MRVGKIAAVRVFHCQLSTFAAAAREVTACESTSPCETTSHVHNGTDSGSSFSSGKLQEHAISTTSSFA